MHKHTILPEISIAPMMDYSDRHARYFLRLFSSEIKLYTEMLTTHALLHGNFAHLLQHHPKERYLALQLGGSDVQDLKFCAKLGESFGYNEINLNVGCPSPRVSKGRFGACLMKEPLLVAECFQAMQEDIKIPVTIKCRLGVDEIDSDESLYHFIETIAKAGCNTFIIHARKAWLDGLSPKENREIPPLQYARAWQVKQWFPRLTIHINGGIQSIAAIESQISHVDGVMIGRAAFANPYLIAEIAQHFFDIPLPSRVEIVHAYLPYVEKELARGTRLHHMSRHLLNLFHQQQGANAFKRVLSEQAYNDDANVSTIEKALLLSLIHI